MQKKEKKPPSPCGGPLPPPRIFIFLTLFCLGLPVAYGDGIILADGRKLSGRVVEKPDGFEVTVDGQTIGLAKSEVKRWLKSPKELLGDADRQVEEAKKLYSEAVVMSDEKAAEARFREALPKVQKAREAYVEARELFPEGYPELDSQLVNIMKLMRLVRERFHSQLVGSDAPVKVKEAPPKPVSAPSASPMPDPAPPTAPSSIQAALAVLADAGLRGDPARRASAAAAFRKVSDGRTPLSDLATAGMIFLGKTDAQWGLLSDTLVVKGPAGQAEYRGRLEKRSDAISLMIQPDSREVRIRTSADGATFITVPGNQEFKAAEVKITAGVRSESFEALEALFKRVDATKLEALDEAEISEGVKALAFKARNLRAKAQPVDALTLLVAGASSALLAKRKGVPAPEIESAIRELGFEKSDFGSVWGTKASLAMDDYRKWIASREYGLAVVQFQSEYREVIDPRVRYATGLLLLFRALEDNRGYLKAATYLESAAQSVSSPTARDHFIALARSIRDEAPCNVCGGTHKVGCSACKGKKKLDLECTKCGGSGKINSFNGVIGCPGCKGQGRFHDVDCPKCKGTGLAECKARGCLRAVPRPSFESFADAYQCSSCRGRGSLMAHIAYPCGECDGVGLRVAPKSDPTKMLR